MYNVLIVEDDPMVAMIDRSYVSTDLRFHVAGVCRDGASALAFLEKTPVQLIILDVYMPLSDGLTLLRQLRERTLPVSVIMVTAANDGATVDEAMRLGVVDYLVKPFSAGRFQQALDRFLKRENVLREDTPFSQQRLDALFGCLEQEQEADELPKGIQKITLESISCFLMRCPGTELTAEEIAAEVGLSRVTVRRYMNYMLEKGMILSRMDYETGGRPRILYSQTLK